jgi:hypothetical protein
MGAMSRDDGDPAQRTPGGVPPTLWGRARARRHRFVDRYERRREERLAGRHHPLKRPIRVTVGVVLILTGVAIGWLPGPGFVIFAIPGSLLVASEWRRAALAMDRLEDETIPRLRRLHARLRGGPKPQWVADDPESWGLWCDRRGYGADDTGERRRSDDLRLEPDPEEQSA